MMMMMMIIIIIINIIIIITIIIIIIIQSSVQLCTKEYAWLTFVLTSVYNYIYMIFKSLLTVIIRVFCPRAGLSLQTQEPKLQF